jgi:hypothetical protein
MYRYIPSALCMSMHSTWYMYVLPSIRYCPRTGDHHEAAASYIYYTTANTRLQTHVLFFPYSCRNSETPTLTNREGKVHAQAIHPLPVHSQGPYFRPTNC